MPALLAEVIGRLLWRLDNDGLAFAGAMLATAASVVGLVASVRRIVKGCEKRRVTRRRVTRR